MQIKTLSEILTQMAENPSCVNHPSGQTTNNPNLAVDKSKADKNHQPRPSLSTQNSTKNINEDYLDKDNKNKQKNHDTDQDTPNPNLAKILSQVQPEALFQDDKKTNYMRYLAFYYLSNRELSKHQLHQKLIDKGCDADAVANLIQEFADKGYQSDLRCAHMLIRENLRKYRGRQQIKQTLKLARLDLDYSLDELIEQAKDGGLLDGTILEDQPVENTNIDWLTLAVEARCKKYGQAIPTNPKDKAKQLRFLQYRGFELSVCLDALKHNPESLSELD